MNNNDQASEEGYPTCPNSILKGSKLDWRESPIWKEEKGILGLVCFATLNREAFPQHYLRALAFSIRFRLPGQKKFELYTKAVFGGTPESDILKAALDVSIPQHFIDQRKKPWIDAVLTCQRRDSNEECFYKERKIYNPVTRQFEVIELTVK